jgi:FkbM family methyltransferase
VDCGMSDNARQKVPFVLASCAHGTMIVSRIDWRPISASHVEFGVGTGILVEGGSDPDLIAITGGMLLSRREKHGPGVLALDCGANFGTFTLEWARQMEEWGTVLSFEPQERIFYALAGNIALNNLFNVKAFHAALGAECGSIRMPIVDYQMPGQYGGLCLRGDGAEIGQPTKGRVEVPLLSIDSLELKRADFIKIDVESMEPEVLDGARETITRCQPYMLIEWIKCGKKPLDVFLEGCGYESVAVGMNMICAPKGDAVFGRVRDYIVKECPPYAPGAPDIPVSRDLTEDGRR